MFSFGNFSLGTLLGLVLGTFLGHVLAVRRGKFQKKHEAAIEFQQEIIPALDALQNGANQFSTVQGSFDAHHKAALKYAAFLGASERKQFLWTLGRTWSGGMSCMVETQQR